MSGTNASVTGAGSTSPPSFWRSAETRRVLAGGALLAAGFIAERAGLGHAATVPIYVVSIALSAFGWAREGWKELVHCHEIGIEALMAAAAVGAAALGLWDEAAALAFLYGLAEAIERRTYDRARRSVELLLDLVPPKACLLRDGAEVEVPAASVKRGDLLRVRPGEAIPADGLVEDGDSAVNEATLTGESMPVEKQPGARVFSGTFNQTGTLLVRATAAFEESAVSRLVRLVETAQKSKARSQKLVERFTRIYAPLVLGSAALMILVALAGWGDAGGWAHRAVLLLVAAAPCALAMSTPVAYAAGLSLAGRHGILVKGGAHLETLGRIRSLAFDKTGTLTRGRPELVSITPLDGATEREVLATAAAVEALSEHPLARAVTRRAEEARVEIALRVTGFAARPGAGAAAFVDGRRVEVLRPEAAALGPTVPAMAASNALAERGVTPALVLADGRPIGLLGFRDELRPEARGCVGRLRALGMTRIVVLSGDGLPAVRGIAGLLGIEDARGGLTPETKVEAVRSLSKAGGPVAMVGDGINDAAALAASDVGIAMGALGSDATIEASDVALMADSLEHLDEAFLIGRRVRTIVRQNVVFSIALLAVLIPVALSGAIGIAVTVVIHEGAELLAVANGLRVLRGARDRASWTAA